MQETAKQFPKYLLKIGGILISDLTLQIDEHFLIALHQTSLLIWLNINQQLSLYGVGNFLNLGTINSIDKGYFRSTLITGITTGGLSILLFTNLRHTIFSLYFDFAEVGR